MIGGCIMKNLLMVLLVSIFVPNLALSMSSPVSDKSEKELDEQCFKKNDLESCYKLALKKYSYASAKEGWELLNKACDNGKGVKEACKIVDGKISGKKSYVEECEKSKDKKATECFHAAVYYFKIGEYEKAKPIFKLFCKTDLQGGCWYLSLIERDTGNKKKAFKMLKSVCKKSGQISVKFLALFILSFFKVHFG
jgi:hypothetical protein